MKEKFEILVDETMEKWGTEVCRIRALRDIPEQNVKAGDLGGFVESEANLSQEGSCWIKGYAVARGNARVEGDAVLEDSGHVYGDATVAGHVTVCGYATIGGNGRLEIPCTFGGQTEVKLRSDGGFSVYDFVM